jgi:hypothetical protein
MRRTINILSKNIQKIKVIPSYEIKGKDDNGEKYKSDLEKPRKVKKETNKEQIKYFISL